MAQNDFFDHFHTLTQIQSLMIKKRECKERIQSEEKRVKSIEEQREQKQQEFSIKAETLKEIRLENTSLENSIHQLETRTSKIKARLPSLVDAGQIGASERELATIEAEHDEKIGQALLMMEQIEELEKLLPEIEQFLKGSSATLLQIKGEVKTNIEKENAQIADIESRIQSMLDSCPPIFKNKFLAASNAKGEGLPLVSIKSDSCSHCNVLLNKQQISDVHAGKSIELCPNCSRLLVPDSVWGNKA